jgi:hypothetical protein
LFSQAGLNINEDVVGDLDGSSFGVGLAGKDSKASKSDLLKITNKKRSKVVLSKAQLVFIYSRYI